MLIPNCYTTITTPDGKLLEITSVNNIEIESTWKKLTDTAKITMPRNVKVVNGDINEVIKRGSKVEIWLGYNGDMNLEFVGYVVRVNAKVPFEIECEDEMWQLKQNRNSYTYKDASIKQIIADVYKGKANVTDFTIGAYRIDRASTAVVLDDLQKNYNVYSYFTHDANGALTLNVGLGGYDFKTIAKRHIYNMMVNVVENDLIYRLADENKMRIVATSTNKGGLVINTEVGDFDGEEIKIDKRGMAITELQKLAEAELQKRKFDGYKGSFTAFGVPYIKHNEVAVLQSPEYPERDGAYIVDAVKTTLGMGGFRRVIDLGIKI